MSRPGPPNTAGVPIYWFAGGIRLSCPRLLPSVTTSAPPFWYVGGNMGNHYTPATPNTTHTSILFTPSPLKPDPPPFPAHSPSHPPILSYLTNHV
jgi:hypothetical protein